MDGFARRHTVDQSDGIYNTCSPVAMDLWRRKPTLSSGYALGLGRFTAINPCQLGYNYYIQKWKGNIAVDLCMQISMNALRELMDVKRSVRISLVAIVAAACIKDTDFRLMEPLVKVSILIKCMHGLI